MDLTLQGVAYGKGRSDCAPEQIDLLLSLIEETQDVEGDIVEVGSWRCGASIAMAAAVPEREVYAFDLFGGLPYGNGQGFENFGDTSYVEIKIAASAYKNLHLVRGHHEHTVPHFAIGQMPLSLIFMDSDHYSSHKVSLENLVPLLSSGGMIVFHDWTFASVQRAVLEVINPEEFTALQRPNMLHMGVLRKK